MVVVSLLTRDRVPAHTAPLHGPAAHAGVRGRRPRLTVRRVGDRPLVAGRRPARRESGMRACPTAGCDRLPTREGRHTPCSPLLGERSPADDHRARTTAPPGTTPSTTRSTRATTSWSCASATAASSSRRPSPSCPGTCSTSSCPSGPHDFMSTKVVGNINVALVFGLLQFVTTFLLAWLYAATPTAGSTRWPRDASTQRVHGRARGTPLTWTHQALTTVLFLAVVALTIGITFWASRQTHGAADYYAGGRGFSGFQNGLAIGGDYMSRRVVPRHLRRHRADRVRRLPLLHRLPGRLAGRAAAGRRDAAQLRPLHDGRPARVPDAAAPGPHRGRHLDRRRVDLLPARPDGRRGRAGGAAARRRRPDRDQPHHLRRRAR